MLNRSWHFPIAFVCVFAAVTWGGADARAAEAEAEAEGETAPPAAEREPEAAQEDVDLRDVTDPERVDPDPDAEAEAEADDEPEPDPAPAVDLPDIVVTATRTPTPLDQIGSTLTLIPREQIEQRQEHFVADSLRTSPGVDIRRTGWWGGQTSIFTRGTNPGHTLLRVDGIKFNDPASPAATPLLDHLTVDAAGRIEMLRGPQSTLYGSEAIGGVINVTTPRGEGPPTHRVSIEGGSFGTVLGRVHSSGGTDRFDYSLGFSHLDTDGIVTTDAATEPNAYQNSSIAGRFGFGVGEDAGIDLFTRVIIADAEFDGGADPDATVTEHRQYGVRLEPYAFLADDFWETRLGLAWSLTDRQNFGESPEGFPQFPTASHGETWQVEWQNILYFDEHTFTFGIDYEHITATFEQPAQPTFDATAYIVGLYGQAQVTPIDRLFLTLGLRVDEHREFGTELTYRTAAAYHLFEATTLRSSFGSAFKAPTLAQLHDDRFGTANPDLRPETSLGFDFGVDQRLFDDRTELSATYFRNHLDDMIVSVFVDPGFRNVNIDRARTQGLEFALTQHIARNLTARASYTFTDTEARRAEAFGITEGSRLLRRPEHKVAFDLNYTFLEQRADVTLSLLYVGERDDIHPTTFQTVTAADYLLLNLAGSLKIDENLSLFGRIENLTNTDYQDVLGFNTPGIGAFGGLRFTF